MLINRRAATAGMLSLLTGNSIATLAHAELGELNLGEGLEDFWLATDAYIYGYPLVTMEMTRRVITNVARPEGTKAPMIIGVTEGYSKGLEIVGTGYRVAQKGSSIEFALGFSHPVVVEAPAGITFTVEGNNKLTVAGIDKQAVGETAANIRKIKKPEPYKGKGIRYAGEVVRRKAGKSGK